MVESVNQVGHEACIIIEYRSPYIEGKLCTHPLDFINNNYNNVNEVFLFTLRICEKLQTY